MTRRPRIEDLTELAVPEQPELSPDGTGLVYVLRTVDATADTTVRSLWRADTPGGQPRRLTTGRNDGAPAWSPDGTRLAFLRAQDGPPQVWLLPMGGGEAEPLTTLPSGAGAPRWSPDGSRIAFTAPVDIRAAPGVDAAARAARATAPVVTERLDYQADGAGLLGPMRQHLHVVDVGTGQCRQVTSGDWHAGDPAWAPDGTRIAFGAATAPDADLTMRIPTYVVDVAGDGASPRLVGLAEGATGAVTWTADGAALLVVGAEGGPLGPAGLLRLPLDGGTPVNLAAALDRTVMAGAPGYPGATPRLVDDGRTVLFCVRDRGCTHLYAVGVDGGEPRLVLGGAGEIVSGVAVGGGTAAVALATPSSYGEIVTVDLVTGARSVRTEHGAALAEVEPFPRVEREFTVSDGTVVHGWLIRDPATTGPAPLLLDIHGGPHNAWNGAADEVHLYHQELAAAGWTVLLLNPRGSDGYGERFYTAAVGNWGLADGKDFLEPLDELVAEGVADPRRLAVAGYSYGGYMTCYLTSRDDRFAAAVTGGVVSDLTSMAGTGDAGQLLARFELAGQPWQDRAHYAAMSPLSRVEHVTTPTLIVQGVEDVRCAIGQAQQWHSALRVRGVPSQLVLYPGGSHLFILSGPPSHRLDFNRRVAEWVQRHAGQVGGPRRAPVDAGHWQRRLDALATRHRVPGATLGILRLGAGGADELVEAAHGVLNTRTGVPVSTDSLFQIGSITKTWTATMVMQLVEDGRLDLDAPVLDVLPELRLSDPEVTKRVTTRHLLTHTSGIDGDVFTDTGRGDDCLQRYVELLEKVAQNHPLGATFSYCNSGYSLLGRVIEKLTGMTWDQAVRERLCRPLGLQHTVTLPEDALLHRTAVGHIAVGDAAPAPAPVWALPRNAGPAGAVTASAADLLAFARMHLVGGLAADGTRVLRAETVAAMAGKQVDLPDKHTIGDSWGLGWIRFDWGGHGLIGHDGNTIGQSAFLRILPEQGLAVTLLTNGGAPGDLHLDLFGEIFAELAGVTVALPLTPPAEPVPVDLTRHVGRYERHGVIAEVSLLEGGPRLRLTATGELAELEPEPVQEFELVAADGSGDLFLVRRPADRHWSAVTFESLPGGGHYLHHHLRAIPKVG